jgi:protein-S-isoprenylcysteine O-methyltransferase Ste14
MEPKENMILPPTYFYCCLAAAVGLHFLYPIHDFLDWPYNLVGLVPLVFGLWIAVQGENTFKKVGTAVKPYLDASKLVTHGPYAISRHPMYLGYILFLIGVGLLLGSIISFVPTAIMFLILQIKFIPMEEKSMMRLFGDDYLAYKRRVRMWL